MSTTPDWRGTHPAELARHRRRLALARQARHGDDDALADVLAVLRDAPLREV